MIKRPMRNNNGDDSGVLPLSLTPDEEAVLMGTLLGDGTMSPHGKGYRLKMEHSAAQEAFVKWKYEKLKRLCTTTKGVYQTKARKTAKAGFGFQSSTLEGLGYYHNVFYVPKQDRGYRKVITQELIDKLPMSPLVLATFFMDDGSVRNDCYSGKLATAGFTKEETILLEQYFKKWGIECSVNSQSDEKGYYYLNFPAKKDGFAKLIQIIEPIIMQVPGMEYKLNAERRPRND